MLCLCTVTLNHQKSLYPGMVNISEIINFSTTWNSSSIPHINNRHYLHALAMHVSCETPLNVLMVLGPKDSGKSEGIIQMKSKWKDIGHIVLDMNLKGKPHDVTGNDSMDTLSKQLVQQLQVLDYNTYLHIHECVANVCYNELDMTGRIIKWSLSNFSFSLTALAGIILSIFLSDYLSKLVELYHIKWVFRFFIAILIILEVLTISVMLIATIFPYFIYGILNPIDSTLRNGDWDTLICFLNCITNEKPQNRPILIIRELINFHPDTLQECLCAMEKAKEKEINLPIILETSDTLWSDVLAVKRSSLSFRPYFMQEMSYDEGKHDMVESGLCTLEEYNLMYENLGGHTGSYQELWHTVRITNSTITSALKEIQKKAYILLQSCVFSKPNLDSKAVLKNMQKHNYSVHINDMVSSIQHLIKCNVLYFNGETLQPQKKVMKHAINQFISKNLAT